MARDVAEKKINGGALVAAQRLADIAQKVSGTAVRYVDIPLEAYTKGLADRGFPAPLLAAIASFQTAIKQGSLAVATNVVEDFTGRAAAYFDASKAAVL